MEQYRVNKVWVDNAHVWTETTNGWKANYPFSQWDNLAKAKQNQRSNFSLAVMAFIGQSSTKTFALRACSPMLVFANVQTVRLRLLPSVKVTKLQNKEGPRLGGTMLKPWATDAQRVGTRCPRLGQPCLMRFLPKLPDVLDETQKYNKVTNLLASLRRAGKIHVIGRQWFLCN